MPIKCYTKNNNEAQSTQVISADNVKTADGTSLQNDLNSIRHNNATLSNHYDINMQKLAEEKARISDLEARLAALENK